MGNCDEFGYEKLDVWQRSMALVDEIYEQTRGFPKEELFGLVAQMRKSAVSVPSNIAEGYGRGSKLFSHHLKIARGSTFELRTQIEVSRRQRFISPGKSKELRAEAIEIAKMLEGLIRSTEN